MWLPRTVCVDGLTMVAPVDFEGGGIVAIDWQSRVEPGTEVSIGNRVYRAGLSRACAGNFHVDLIATPEPAVVEPEPEPARVGKKGRS